MKSILIIETPKNCAECKLIHLQGIGESICNAVDWEERPSWCPLRPLPQKMTMEKALKMERVGAIKDIYTTWNACLDEITGEIE